MRRRYQTIVVVVALLCLGAAGPALGGGGFTNTTDRANGAQSDGGDVDVTVGAQLSTVVSATDREVRTDFENAAFDRRVDGENASEQATAIADRLAELVQRTDAIEREYENVSAAYGQDDVDRSEYARQLADLNARATNLLEAYDALADRAAEVDDVELRAAGVNESAIDDGRSRLERYTGAGERALFAQFAGEARGDVDLAFESDGSLSIEIENEDGERSRELERPRDGNGSLALGQTEALEIAKSALSNASGSWVLESAETDADDGAYEFEFELRGVPDGEAEVGVDGSSGTIFALEEEIEAEDDDDDQDGDDDRDDDDDSDDDDESLVILVESGTPGPGETVTLRLLADGEPATGATVALEDERAAETDANGTVDVTLPHDEAEIEAKYGDADAELEFDFESDDRPEDRFDVSGTVENDTVTVSATFDGDPVADAAVFADDERVGTTGENGSVSFALPGEEEDVDVDVVRGELEGELEIEYEDGVAEIGGNESDDSDDGDDSDDSDDDDDGDDDDSDDDDDDDDD